MNNYVFTTSPVLMKLARGCKAIFDGKSNPRFDEIRGLFLLPSLTMHFVTCQSSGVSTSSEMDGNVSYRKRVLLCQGKCKISETFFLEGRVDLAEVELSKAVPVLKLAK